MSNRSEGLLTIPNPDPTLLTTAQLHREIDLIYDRMNDKVDGIHREMATVREYNQAAIGKSESSYEKRFESVNEFRAQMADQAGKFMTSVESRAMHTAAGARIDELMRRVEGSEGRGAGLVQGWGFLVGAIGMISSLVIIVIWIAKLNGHA